MLQIRLGADIQLKDINSRNVLHLVVMNGGRLEDFAANCKVSLSMTLLSCYTYAKLNLVSNIRVTKGCCSCTINSSFVFFIYIKIILFIISIYLFIVQDRCEKSLAQLLNEKDNTGCSPLHYASREGHIRSLENLIKLGACINLKNNNNESPLHFAARYDI